MKQKLRAYRSHSLAVLLGFALTLAMVSTAYFYYNTREAEKGNPFYFTVSNLHNRMADLKMRLKGLRQPHPDFAIVGIDNRSLASEGRWPWGRDKVAELVEELFAHDVKAVGLDIIFSEPSNVEIQKLISRFSKLSSETKVKRQAELEAHEFNADKKLEEVFAKNSEKIVSASFFHIPQTFLKHPYQKLCYNAYYEDSEEFPSWESQGFDFIDIVQDQSVPPLISLPSKFEKLLKEKLQAVREQTQKRFCLREKKPCPESLDPAKKNDLAASLKRAQREYCANWLIEKDDPYYKHFEKLGGVPLDKVRQGGLQSALFPVEDWSLNIAPLHEAARWTGFLNTFPDTDGTVRQTPLLVRTGPLILPSMSLRLAMIHYGADGGQISLKRNAIDPGYYAVSSLELTQEGEKVVYETKPSANGQARIHYAGPSYTFPHVSALELLKKDEPNLRVTQLKKVGGKLKVSRNESVDKNFLRGKTVILGVTATGVYDLRVTPFSENFPGVEAQLTVAENLMQSGFIRDLPDEPVLMILTLLLIGAILSFALSFTNAATAAIFAGNTLLALILIDYHWFYKNGYLVTALFPFLLVVILWGGITLFKYFTEERHKKALRGTFEKYVSPAIVEEVLADPSNIELGGRKENVTVFFSDVRGFTTISETLSPTDLSDLLNEYLTPMTEIIFENKGTLDKYIGDAIMAFFGAPIPHANHAEQAARTALQNVERLKELQVELNEKGLPHIDIGIGLNTGDVSVGNMGSNIVRNYTIMGDTVNLGARLEGITKQYGARIIISEYTKNEIGDNFIVREVDCVRVKGKHKPVHIFELLGENSVDDETEKVLESFNRGYELYHKKEWENALKSFQKALSVRFDFVSNLYVQRCTDYLGNPPPEDWDGVFVMKTK